MFNPIQNKYTKWYFNIIKKRQTSTIQNEYVEKHHIVPKSLGGSNKKDNIVALTAREHYICHLLLTKMFSNESKRNMHYAFLSMHRKKDGMERYKPNSYVYSIIRKNISRVPSDETRLRMSISGKKREPASEQTRKKLSESTKASYTPELRAKRSSQFKNRIVTDETRKKMRLSKLGKKASDVARKKMSESSKKGEKHPKAKCWILVSPDEKIYRVLNMRIFCDQNNLSYSALRNKSVQNDKTPVTRGASLGWCLLACTKISETIID